jgi:uncharacterized membrane protein
MRTTRKIIAEFVGVFLIGAIAGGLVTWNFSNSSVNATVFLSNTADKPDAMLVRLNKKYVTDFHLSPEELQRIQPTLKDMAQNIYLIRHQFGADMMGALDKYHDEISAQLTPEHRADYDKAIAERHKRLSALLLPDESSPSPGAK